MPEHDILEQIRELRILTKAPLKYLWESVPIAYKQRPAPMYQELTFYDAVGVLTATKILIRQREKYRHTKWQRVISRIDDLIEDIVHSVNPRWGYRYYWDIRHTFNRKTQQYYRGRNDEGIPDVRQGE